MDNEILLGISFAFSMFCALFALFSVWVAHSRISDLKTEYDLQTKDFVYQSRERFTALETKMKEKEEAIYNWKIDTQTQLHMLEDKLCG